MDMDMEGEYGDGEGGDEELFQDESWHMLLVFFLWNVFDTFLFNARNPPGLVANEDAAHNLVRRANAGPGMVQSAEEPAAPIQGESVVRERLVARVREMGLSRPD
jgi:hypothetical protein